MRAERIKELRYFHSEGTDVDECLDEIDRLRAALTEILTAGFVNCDGCMEAPGIARRALEGK